MPQGNAMNDPASPAQAPTAVVIKNDQSTPSSIKIPASSNTKVILTGLLMLLLVSGIGVGVFLARNRTQLSSQAAANVGLGFNPAQIDTQLDQTFEATVTIDTSDQSVTGTELHISYDPQLFILESFEKGTFLPNSVGQSEIDNGSANITLIPNLSNLSPGKGKGDLAFLKFKVIRTSTTPAEISVDKTKTQISAEGQDNNALGTTTKMIVNFGTDATASPSPGSSLAPSPSAGTTTSTLPSPTPVASTPGGIISSANPSASPLPSPSSRVDPKKDFNGDGKVNSVDLSFMYSAWGTPKTEAHKKADLNLDGVVNGIDYSLFLPGFSP